MAKRALVVDNDFFFVEFLSDLLSQHGYEIRKAYDGKEGMEKLESETIDILFVDLVMPKIDGPQLIEFARRRFADHPFPIVAVSATILEHMDDLRRINADYYIAKGPMEQMTGQFQELIGKIDHQPLPDQEAEKLVDSGEMFPRREAVELIDSVRFQRAIFESIGVGVLVVDRDAKIMSANPQAAALLGREAVGLLNRPVPSAFPPQGRSGLVQALKTAARDPERRKAGFAFQTERGAGLRGVVSLFRLEGQDAGWVVALEDTVEWDEPA